MDKCILRGLLVAISFFVFFGLIIGAVQLSWWNDWDENIKLGLISEKQKCTDIQMKNLIDSEEDLINYERAGEDKNVFSISQRCYKLENDFDFVYRYDLKGSYWARLSIWILLLFVSIMAGVIIAGCNDDY